MLIAWASGFQIGFEVGAVKQSAPIRARDAQRINSPAFAAPRPGALYVKLRT
jgi:hypothetical protein